MMQREKTPTGAELLDPHTFIHPSPYPPWHRGVTNTDPAATLLGFTSQPPLPAACVPLRE